jgi:uncharacterized protein YceH (UPF0502 family)
MSDELPVLTAHEARILGCLIEKKETTPDIYPLTLNALQAAANQKTSREPVMSLEPSDIHRALKLLERKGLVRQNFGSRVERYEHLAAACCCCAVRRRPTNFCRAPSAWRAWPRSRSSSPIST